MLDFLFVGIGQCGNKFVDCFAFQKNKAIAINTTQKDMNCLKNIDKQNLINIEATGTKGGAGKTPILGEKAMQEHLTEVYDKVSAVGKDIDYYVLWAGLGGGTGSGGLPVLLKKLLAENKKIILGLTLPDDTEGVEVQSNAFNACINILKIIEQYKVPYMIIENNKIKEKMKSVIDFDWRSVNTALSKIFTQFNKAANKNSPYLTFDETDYKKTLYISGMMTLTKVVLDKKDITTDNSLRDAVLKSWREDNFFVDFDCATARILTTIIDAPEDYLADKTNYKLIESSLLKLRDTCGTISPYTGIYPYNEKIESNRKSKIIIYCMLTGLKAPIEKLQLLQKKAKDERDAMLKKVNENKIDFSSFETIGNVLNMENEKENKKENDEFGLDGDIDFLS